MLWMWTQAIVSTGSDDGHLHSSRHAESAVPVVGREATDCRRDVGGGASVALVARAHGVNANLVFNWRSLYKAGRRGGGDGAKLLPVKVAPESSPQPTAPLLEPRSSPSSSAGTIHVQLQHAQVSIEGSADPGLLRVLVECLQRGWRRQPTRRFGLPQA